MATTNSTITLYESSHRILKLLTELAAVIPDRKIIVAREITKKFEEVQMGTPSDVSWYFETYPERTKGEFVVIVEAQ